jgi:predicted amidohydrolase YtcJ
VNQQDVPRFSQLGVIADFQMSDASAFPNTFDFYFGIYLSPTVLAQEPHRLRTIYDTGARVVLSSDYDVGSISPFLGMHHALTRGVESLPTLDAAIAAYTIEPAYLMRQENTVGSLEVGKRADLIVLDRNLFTIPVSQIPGTQVLMTLLDGAEVWRDPTFTPLGDLNGDFVVNAADLAALLAQWGTAGPADLNDSGVIDAADLATLLANWG